MDGKISDNHHHYRDTIYKDIPTAAAVAAKITQSGTESVVQLMRQPRENADYSYV